MGKSSMSKYDLVGWLGIAIAVVAFIGASYDHYNDYGATHKLTANPIWIPVFAVGMFCWYVGWNHFDSIPTKKKPSSDDDPLGIL